MTNKKCDANIHKTSIGGQAVMEGVMMRGPKKIAVSVRKPDGEIITDVKELGKARTGWMVKLPIVRGCVNFFDSMITGVKALMFSAQFFDIEDDGTPKEQEPSKFEAWLEKKLDSERAMNVVIYISVILSLLLSVGLFILLPGFIGEAVRAVIDNNYIVTLAEGIIRIGIFIIYLALVSQMKDIKRVFMYHGAEHKSIHCYEHGEELTVENVKRHTRLHPRCGTSFLLIVMVVSMLAFFFIPKIFFVYRLLLRLALLPIIAGISYEIIKFAGRHDNAFTRVISKPGMWFQYITTNEPDDDQIEVAITALKAVIPDDREEDKW
ncbi:MAG: DUF1385 domain-containing protein [Clostridia bacterium]|nr:DUF1385 domain-containing protein [Clostridia bacterium]